MTAGDKGSAELSRSGIAAVRRQEARCGADMLGASSYTCLEFSDLEILFDNSARRKVAAMLRRIDAGIVFTTPPVDYMADHEITSRLVRDALFQCSRCRTTPPTAANARPPEFPRSTIAMRSAGTTCLANRRVCIVSSISRMQMERKAEALACHDSSARLAAPATRSRRIHRCDASLGCAAWSTDRRRLRRGFLSAPRASTPDREPCLSRCWGRSHRPLRKRNPLSGGNHGSSRSVRSHRNGGTTRRSIRNCSPTPLASMPTTWRSSLAPAFGSCFMTRWRSSIWRKRSNIFAPGSRATPDNPVGLCGPIGPTEQLPLVALLVNALDLSLHHAHFWGMDEWLLDGEAVEESHPLSFARADRELCFNRIRPELAMPSQNLHFPKSDVRGYEASWEGVRCAVMQGGQGEVKHWAFNDPVRRTGEFRDAPPSPEVYRRLGTRSVELHPLTIVQNARTSGGGNIPLVPTHSADGRTEADLAGRPSFDLASGTSRQPVRHAPDGLDDLQRHRGFGRADVAARRSFRMCSSTTIAAGLSTCEAEMH